MSMTARSPTDGPTARNGRQSTHPLFALGFRPFYLLAAVFAAVSVPLWLALHADSVRIESQFAGMMWHEHEMLFGYVAAVLAGFLLTAVPNWTGHPTPRGGALAALAGLWLAGRLAVAAGGLLPFWLVAAVDLAFLPALAATLLLPLVKARNRRNIAFPFALLAMAGANLVVHLDAAGVLSEGQTAVRAVLAAVLVILVIMGGRVIPFFTANRLPAAGAHRDPQLDRLATLAAAAAAALMVAVPYSAYSGIAAALAALFLLARSLPWRAAATRRLPILWILHAGHAWLVVALTLVAARDFGAAVPSTAPDHALAVGAIGSLTLGMMARSALGHTGRRIEASRWTAAAFVAVNLAAVVRTFGPMAVPDHYGAALIVAGTLWTLAFTLFVADFAPILLRSRVDGKPG